MIFTFYKKLRNKIAYRLLLYILLFSGVVTIIITATQLYIEYQRDIDAIDDQFNRIEISFKKPLIEALWFFNEKAIRLQLEGISNFRDIEYLELVGEGNISIIVGQKLSKYTIKNHLPLIYTGKNINREIGRLTIVASMMGVYSRLFDRLITILITQSIKTFLVTTFIYLLFHFLVVRHISTIGIYLKKFGFKGRPQLLELQRKSTSPGDELDQTVSSINEMTVKLYKSHETINSELFMRKEAEKKLQKGYDELEQIVAQRTKSLKEERDRAQNYLDIAAVIMVVINTNQEVFLINKKGCEILGYGEAEITGKNWFDNFLPVSIKDRNRTVFNGLMAAEIEPVGSYENLVLAKGGEERIIAWNDTILKDDEGNIIGTLSSGEDITERKRAEEERVKLQEQLFQSRKMEAIGSLAGGIAHEFNNILGTIIGNTELAINDVPESNPARECLKEIQTASLRAKGVVGQMLGFARKSVFQLRPIRISPIISETLKLIRASIPTTIEIRQNLSCKSDTVMADTVQINQVLISMCTNAKNAMQEEGGVLEVKLQDTILDEKSATRYEDLSPGNYVKLTVKDSGHGIDPKIIDRIFDPYFTTTSMAEGTGMGLAVVHGIVKHHNGAISVESEPGKGTVFEVLFPLTEAEAEQEAGESEGLPTGTERILFIDDEKSLVKLGQKMLNQLGYSVETKRNPVEALELVRSEPDRFDLIITDMTMPQMTGDKLAKEILSIRPDMPIILCTGFSEKIDDKKAQALGIRKYIEKPFVPSDFVVAVRKVLDAGRSEA